MAEQKYSDIKMPTGMRQLALELAIRTVVNAREITPNQIVNIADTYEKYLTNGTVAPMPQTATPEVDADAEV